MVWMLDIQMAELMERMKALRQAYWLVDRMGFD